jgi:thiamine biosynthesis lipoprotein
MVWTALLCMTVVTACGKQPQLHHEQLLALGTVVEINLWGVEPELARQASREVTDVFNRMHQRWHAWEPGHLMTINRQLQETGTAPVDPETRRMIRKALALSRASQSLFNPGIGDLIALWGFHSDDPPAGPPPAPEAIQAYLGQRVTMDDLTLTEDHVVSTNPALQLDLGGFAKGYAVDAAVERLKTLGIEHAIVNAGGDLRAIGRRGERPWRVGVRHPRQTGVMAAIETRGDESIFTSGDYERFFEYQGKRYHHIIDPRNGYPAAGAASVTVIHKDAATADAAATALLIAGPDQWQSVARAMGIDYVMLVDDNEAVYLTEAMADRIKFTIEPKRVTVIE